MLPCRRRNLILVTERPGAPAPYPSVCPASLWKFSCLQLWSCFTTCSCTLVSFRLVWLPTPHCLTALQFPVIAVFFWISLKMKVVFVPPFVCSVFRSSCPERPSTPVLCLSLWPASSWWCFLVPCLYLYLIAPWLTFPTTPCLRCKSTSPLRWRVIDLLALWYQHKTIVISTRLS